ncbi:MAG: hypothetical protein AB7F35_23965 [Acetobacteraceae bacterium]
MDVIELLGDAGRILFQVLAVVLPLLAWQWIVHMGRPARGTEAIIDATVVSGGMVGLAAIPYIIPPMALGWDAVVTPNGVWDLTLGEFYARVVRYASAALPDLISGLLYDDQRKDLLVWLSLALTIWALRIVVALVGRGTRPAMRLLGAEVMTFAASVYGVVYLGPLLLWSVNRLNFWLLLVMILLIQDHRHNEPPVVSRLVTTLRYVVRRRPVVSTVAD